MEECIVWGVGERSCIPLANGSALTTLNVSMKGAQVKGNKQASSFIAIYVAVTVRGTQATQ